MAYQVVSFPIPLFFNSDGTPLNDGNIYIGQSGLNPESYPVSIYWDSSLTQAAAQPIKTTNGYPSRNGTSSRIYTDLTSGAYSITVKDRNGSLIFSNLATDYILTDVTVGPVSEQISIDAATASAAASSASASATIATNAAISSAGDASSALSSATIAAAYANMDWANFSLSDGDLIVSYTSGATSLPSLVDGEFIITY